MYSYIKGKITEVCATHITLECNNIGYMVKVPNPYQYEIESSVTLYIHQNVREDLIELYGFSSHDEKQMFINLISVKGLGPKGALAILASSTLNEISSAINSSNSKYFNSFPGIGSKISGQIILDLRGKLNKTKNNKDNEKIENVTLALKSLGYTSNEIKKVLNNLVINENTTLKDVVKNALKLLKSK